MFNSDKGYSLSDIAAATGNRNNGSGFGNGDGAWWIIILFLFIFCGWGEDGRGGLFGGNGSTRSGITDGYILTSDFANIERKIDGVNNGICDGFYNQAQLINGVNNNISSTGNSILTQMNNNAVNSMQDTFALQTALNGNLNSITSQLTNLGTQMQQCCCDQRYESATNFANLNYNIATQECQTRQAITDSTRDIVDNQNANTRSILDFLTQDKIASLTAENQSLKFAASQQAQNSYLVNALSPAPIPAYTVANPYTGRYGYGCSSPCGCSASY